MLRLYRKTILPRWHVNRKTSTEKKNVKHSKPFTLCTTSPQNFSHSHHHNDQKKQHADKKEHCWDDPQFHFNFIPTSFETAGWLGTAAVYISCHLKNKNKSIFEYDKATSSCIFSNIVLAMPRRSSLATISSSNTFSPSSSIDNQKEGKAESATDTLKRFKNLAEQYISRVHNSAGIRNIEVNERKAFRCFQSAARLGSGEGFYNLGLCYHLGKGTKVNLNMAAFCYRKAAMKGHGLASFNLAIFFYKGVGGLPVDTKIAKELLAEAAEKGVPEAQLYFGIEFLEEKRFLEASKIFINLAEKNNSDAQYYLGLCYEGGLGVPRNQRKATKFFMESAVQGNNKAIHKLQNYQKMNGVNSCIKPAVIKSIERHNLHISASVPELGAIVKQPIQNIPRITISSYLGLITPFLVAKDSDFKSKDSCFSNENKVVKEYSPTFLPFRSIPFIMQVKL